MNPTTNEFPTIEEIKRLVAFERRYGVWCVSGVRGNVGGDIEGNVGGNVYGRVEGDVRGNVKGDVYGDVYGNVGGDVFGNVGGTICGKKWHFEKTLKDRIIDAIDGGNTALATELLEAAVVLEG